MLSISSLAMAARWPPHSLASISTSLAITSSFFCTSPCTFSLPALSSTSPSAPLLTLMAMRLQARATTSISRRSWPGMCPCSRCCSTRYWVSETRWVIASPFASVLQGARDDLARVGREVGARGHAGDRLARGIAVGLREGAPAVQRAGQPRGELRVDRVDLDHAVGPEHIARSVAAVEGPGVLRAQREQQAARAVRVAQREVGMLRERAGAREHGAVALAGSGLEREPLV